MLEAIQTHGFYDLYIQDIFFAQGDLKFLIKYLYDYGYRTIAISQLIDGGNLEHKKKKKKGENRDTQEVVPVPYHIGKIQETATELGYKNFKVLNRLTVSFADQDIIHKIIKSPNFKKYDIIAFAPTTTQALSYTCNSSDADIFTFNPENKFSLRLNRKTYNQLIDKGYHIELLYSCAIEDSTKRKNLIHAAHLFHSFGKSRNIFFSSGTDKYIYIRSPYDIVSLGFIFGLSELKCKCAVNEFPQKVIINSVGRKQGKAVMFVESLKTESEKDVSMEMSEEEQEEMDTNQPKTKRTKV